MLSLMSINEYLTVILHVNGSLSSPLAFSKHMDVCGCDVTAVFFFIVLSGLR